LYTRAADVGDRNGRERHHDGAEVARDTAGKAGGEHAENLRAHGRVILF
jgi:hypothetical protein